MAIPLNERPAHTITKSQQVKSNRWKPKQKTLGAISDKVREEVRQRSGGICEVRVCCNGAPAVEQAHIRGRRIIGKTTKDWLRDSCKECHVWLDSTGNGAVHKRKLREEQAQ